jgi:predicted polyphosphate/ATP-dependent NAD kinase
MPMKRICAALAVAAITAFSSSACSRTVQVRTAPTTAEATIHFTNNLPQAVNVYVVQSGTETFVRQVAANTTENLPVRGIPQGSQVVLRAVTVDGKSQFDSQTPMALTSTTTWRVP